MIVNPINVSHLTVNQTYTNLKMSMLQKGLLVSFVVNFVNLDGTFNVSLIYNDASTSTIIMDVDAVVFEVDDEALNILPLD